MIEGFRENLIDVLRSAQGLHLPSISTIDKSAAHILKRVEEDNVLPDDNYLRWMADIGMELSLIAIAGLPALEEKGVSKEQLLMVFNIYAVIGLLEAWYKTAGKMASGVALTNDDLDWLDKTAGTLGSVQ